MITIKTRSRTITDAKWRRYDFDNDAVDAVNDVNEYDQVCAFVDNECTFLFVVALF